jgi:adenine-specific DNA-methyltransferase
MPKTKRNSPDKDVEAYRHDEAKRKNIPSAKMAGEGEIPKAKKAQYHYNPHLSPQLRYDPTGKADRLEDIRQKVVGHLDDDEKELLDAAFNSQQPWLEWAEKKEQHDKKFFEVDPVALHIHERVSAQAIVRTMQRKDTQRDLFADPQLPYQKAVEFYQHDVDWANRLILGDSLQVMSSLARRENLAGQVQMIYMDPPYGINYGSNFQPEIRERNVRENEHDLTREPEMVKAYRDTWVLGVHSYLTYLKERLFIARELLNESGSVFVQISDVNLHRVRAIMDEVFGPDNFQAQICYRTSVPLKSTGLASICDFIIWYSKNHNSLKRHDLFTNREVGSGGIYNYIEEPSGHRRTMSKDAVSENTHKAGVKIFGTDNLVSSGYTRTCIYPVEYEGKTYNPTSGKSWKTNTEGMRRLKLARRVNASGKTLRAMMYIKDYPVQKMSSLWTDTKGESDKRYVVQTASKIIQRCLMMSTDPGDLVLDPTCGSGTTAHAAETWGRRWISIDSSRVSLAIARQRLLTAQFDYYRLSGRTIADGFECRTVPHITLGSIAQNENLDPIFDHHEPILESLLSKLNTSLADGATDRLREKLVGKLQEKVRNEKAKSITDADLRRWLLPGTDKNLIKFGTPVQKLKWQEAIPPEKQWQDWEVPFDADTEWPKPMQNAVTEYRQAWRKKMDDVGTCINANAAKERLVDQPEIDPGVLRVSGPFTVEGVNPEELSLDEDGLFDGTPNEWEGDDSPAGNEPQNINAYLSRMVDLINNDGVTFPNNQHRKFGRNLEPVFEGGSLSGIHAEGVWESSDEDAPKNIAIAFGPQYGPVTALQVEDLIHASRRYDELVIAGFSFDAAACEIIEQNKHPKLKVHMAHIRPDVSPGMDGLLKETPNNQLFTVFGQPDLEIQKDKSGEIQVVFKGVDIYNPLTGEVNSSGADKVAAWFLDTDYDGRCFCITQAFFPDKKAWYGIAKSLGERANKDAIAALTGTVSLPFIPGQHERVALKVIDPRGNEVMALRSLKE